MLQYVVPSASLFAFQDAINIPYPDRIGLVMKMNQGGWSEYGDGG